MINKKKLYEILGAEKWQSVVFKVEQVKFIVLEKFPSIIKKYESFCDRICERKCKKHPELTESLRMYYQMEKIKFRKEVNTKQNRNYHFDSEHPSYFLNYLKMNRNIHMKGLLKNIVILLSIIMVSSVLSVSNFYLLFLTFCEIVSLFINFECVNLQNYNLERFNDERIKENLKKLEEKKMQKNLEKYNNCSKGVLKAIVNNVTVPTVNETINYLSTPVEIEEMLGLVQNKLDDSLTLKRVKKER